MNVYGWKYEPESLEAGEEGAMGRRISQRRHILVRRTRLGNYQEWHNYVE